MCYRTSLSSWLPYSTQQMDSKYRIGMFLRDIYCMFSSRRGQTGESISLSCSRFPNFFLWITARSATINSIFSIFLCCTHVPTCLDHGENPRFTGSQCAIIREKMTFTVPKHHVAFSKTRQRRTFPASLFFSLSLSVFCFISTQLNPSKGTERIKMGWENVSVMGTCCVYDEYRPICLPLEGKHVWHLVLTLSLLLGCLFFLTEMDKGAFSHFII